MYIRVLDFIKKHELLLLLGTTIFVFFSTIWPSFINIDLYYHIKAGEIFSKYGILHKDVFAYTTQGREWYPFEWGFEVIVYNIHKYFGFGGIDIFIAAVTTAAFLGIYFNLRKNFSLNAFLSLSFSLLFIFINYFLFFSSRPSQVCLAFFSWNLFFLLAFILRNKNFLILSLPITLLWTNMHGSIVLDVALFFGFTITLGFYSIVKKRRDLFMKVRTLGIFAILTFIITILPPLGFTQYRQLFLFWKENALLSDFIYEWYPLYNYQTNHLYFYLYLIIILVVLIIFLLSLRKNPNKLQAILLLPLLPLIYLPFVNNRHFPFGSIALITILGFSLMNFKFNLLTKRKKILSSLMVIGVLLFFGINFWQYRTIMLNSRTYNGLPVEATNFISKYDLKGNLFNEFGAGFYMLYYFYPERKVFVDGRADLYLCCEIPLVRDLMNQHLEEPNNIYKKQLDYIWNRYKISYVVIGTGKEQYVRKISDVLFQDPNWQLVFWDDKNEIFVRKDGKNNKILKEFGANAATPYLSDYYLPGKENEALNEYRRMIKIADSAKSRNGIGVILARQGKLEEAKNEFVKALDINLTEPASFENLAEIYIVEKNWKLAEKMYYDAYLLSPGDSIVYLRLGQLYFEIDHDRNKARNILEKGLSISGSLSKPDFEDLLHKYGLDQ